MRGKEKQEVSIEYFLEQGKQEVDWWKIKQSGTCVTEKRRTAKKQGAIKIQKKTHADIQKT